MLQQCLHDSLDLQRGILQHWSYQNKLGNTVPTGHSARPFPAASSMPYTCDPYNRRPGHTETETPHFTQTPAPETQLQSISVDFINTARVLAAALHQAKLEFSVFTNDGVIHPEEGLQSVNTYKNKFAIITLNHVEDDTSQSLWNTPFRVKVNFKGAALEATLDIGAPLSVVCLL